MYSAKALAKKRKKKIVIVLLSIVIYIVSFTPFIVRRIYKIENVFDEMYYSGQVKLKEDGSLLRWGPFATGCSYSRVGVYKYGRWMDNTDQYMAEDFGVFERPYIPSELNKGESITISVYLNEKEMGFVCRLEDIRSPEDPVDSWLHWGYSYSVEENIMYINGPILYFLKEKEFFSTTDEEQIALFLQENGYDKTVEEYEHYFLYDKIIHDWTLGNLFCSRYSTWWIGHVKFVDGPPPQETA